MRPRTWIPGGLTVPEFLERMRNMGADKPVETNVQRWAGMLKWYQTRHTQKDWIEENGELVL